MMPSKYPNLIQENKYQHIYFLSLVELEPSKQVCKKFQLEKSLIFFHAISIQLFINQLFFDYFFTKTFCMICPVFNFCLFSPLNILSLGFLIKSLHNNKKFQYVYVSNLLIMSALIYHFALFCFNSFFQFYFSSIDLFYIFSIIENCCEREEEYERFVSFIFPNFLYLVYECFVYWISYSHTIITCRNAYSIVSCDEESFEKDINDKNKINNGFMN